MINSSKILSIVIPTYNRGNLLDKQLSWAIESIGDRWDSIELLVCDNASDDNTLEVCAKWIEYLSDNIRVFRNDSNVGLVKNCLLGLERATGKFAWLVGDDDNVTVEAVDVICNAIKINQDAGVFLLNHRYVSGIDNSIIIPKFYQVLEDVNIPKQAVSSFSKLLFNHDIRGILFITANVLNREYALQFIENNPPQDELLIAYPMLLSAGLATNHGFYLIAQCLVDCTAYLSSWRDQEKYVQFEAIPKTLLLFKQLGVDKQAIMVSMKKQYENLNSIKDAFYLMRKNPFYLTSSEFKVWAKRKLLQRNLEKKVLA